MTTFVPVVAGNFGDTGIAGRGDRYARANEFLDVVLALWRSFPAGALVADVASGTFTDPALVRPIGHTGAHFQVSGPLPLPPSPQRFPLIVQAGASDAGRDLAARTADAVFSGAVTVPAAAAYAADIRARARGHGRESAAVAVLPGLLTSIGGTEREALDRLAALDDLAQRDDALPDLAAKLHVDPDALRLDHPVPRRLLPDEPGVHVLHTGALRLAREGVTVRDILRRLWRSGHLVAAGAPEQVADIVQEWFEAGAADGFTLMPDVIADGLPAFVDHVVPVLQRRGLFRTGYREATLRERFGQAPVSR